nr:serine/threonine-protein kinase [Pseudenhygromyxa sp. WMMC2535]
MVIYSSHIAWDLRRNLHRARTLGRYELRRRLGRGGMGEVWAAWHAGLRQEVALKILPLPRVPDERAARAVARFEREVFATTKLRHPNTVRVYDFGLSAEGFWYYAMELLDGETVGEIVAREGPQPIARALNLLRQAARALGEAHELGITHRDIKPENLFVSTTAGEHDFIKVLDFGVASVAAEASIDLTPSERVRRAPAVPEVDAELGELEPGGIDAAPAEGDDEGADAHESSPVTNASRAVGTPLYISPEVARGEAADSRSDIYALGCVLYFMLTSRPVFAERDTRAVMRAHVEREPTPPSEQLEEPLPYYVETVIMRCLAKEPKLRYQSTEALVRAIDLCLRLHDNDRRRGVESLPRVRDTIIKVEEWVEAEDA